MDDQVVNQVVSLDSCSPHPQNYNKHHEAQLGDLRRSLKRFGQVRSIVVQDDGAEGYLIVAGHGIVDAARAEGFTQLRADVIPSDWTPQRVLAYLAADNELARQAIPDAVQFANILEELQDYDRELAELAAGSSVILEEILAEFDPDVEFKEYDTKNAGSQWFLYDRALG